MVVARNFRGCSGNLRSLNRILPRFNFDARYTADFPSFSFSGQRGRKGGHFNLAPMRLWNFPPSFLGGRRWWLFLSWFRNHGSSVGDHQEFRHLHCDRWGWFPFYFGSGQESLFSTFPWPFLWEAIQFRSIGQVCDQVFHSRVGLGCEQGRRYSHKINGEVWVSGSLSRKILWEKNEKPFDYGVAYLE